MASNLLKTFEKIESGRKSIINALRANYQDVGDDASFIELSGYIGNTPYSELVYNKIERPKWERPSYWPDTHNILAEAEMRGSLTPTTIVLVEVYDVFTEDSTTFPAKANASGYHSQTNASGVLTSDGAWYDLTSASATHTWDETQYIIINGHKFRWYIYYFDLTSISTSGCNITISDDSAIELLLGDVGLSGTLVGGVCNSNTLINLEFLPSFRPTYLQPYNKSGGACLSLHRLEHIDYGNINRWAVSNYVSAHPDYSFYLKRIDGVEMGGYSTNAGSNYGIPYHLTRGAPNLSEINVHAGQRNKSIVLSRQLPLFAELKENGYKLEPADLHDRYADVAVPDSADLDIHNGTCVYLKRTRTYNYYSPLVFNLPNLTTLDLTDFSGSSSYSVTANSRTMQIRPYYNCPKLSEILFKQANLLRFDFTGLDVPKNILLDLIDSLKDLNDNPTGIVYYYPAQKLGVENLAKLTAAEIAVAEAKGWRLV